MNKYDEFEADQHLRGQLNTMNPGDRIVDRLGREWIYDGWIEENGVPSHFCLRPASRPHIKYMKMLPFPDDEYWTHFPFYKP